MIRQPHDTAVFLRLLQGAFQMLVSLRGMRSLFGLRSPRLIWMWAPAHLAMMFSAQFPCARARPTSAPVPHHMDVCGLLPTCAMQAGTAPDRRYTFPCYNYVVSGLCTPLFMAVPIVFVWAGAFPALLAKKVIGIAAAYFCITVIIQVSTSLCAIARHTCYCRAAAA